MEALPSTITSPFPKDEAPKLKIDFGQPCETIYVQNLNDRINVKKMNKTLTDTFKQYGTVLDVITKKSVAYRGQAWIVFDNLEMAGKAIEAQGTEIYDKPMAVRYAKAKNDRHITDAADLQSKKRSREERRAEQAEIKKSKPKRAKIATVAPVAPNGGFGTALPIISTKSQAPAEFLPPNSTLFVENLPTTISEEAIEALFSSYGGFKEVRIVPSKRDIAFVEYDDEVLSAVAKNGLQGHQVEPGHDIKITFARK